MFRDKEIDQRFHSGAVHVEAFERLLRAGGTFVRLLVLVEIGHHRKAVLEIVDAEFGRLAIGHRADMAGDLQPARMRRVDRRLHLRARGGDVHLERGRALVRPVVHRLRRVVGAAQRMHLQDRKRAVEIGPGHIEIGADIVAPVDGALQVDVAIGRHRAAGARRRRSAREIEPRKGVEHGCIVVPPHRVEQMLVHHHEAGQQRLAARIDDRRAFRNVDMRADGRDAPSFTISV